MKSIIHNDDYIGATDIEIYRHKVRALIINQDQKVAVCKYGGIYMLPGGKCETGEQEVDCLIREVLEETGIDLNNHALEPIVNIKNYLDNYPEAKANKLVRKLTDTTYYVVHTNHQINVNLVNLTPSEKEHDFTVEWYDIETLRDLLKTYQSDNPRKDVFDRDLLAVLDLYQSQVNSIDLHTHTTYSDGEYTPNQLIEVAIKQGVNIISITDHDNVDAYRNLNIPSNIQVIPGIELTAKFNGGRMHILGYGIDPNNEELKKTLKKLEKISINKIVALLAILKKDYNISFSKQELQTLFNNMGNLGRPDIALLLINNGYATDVSDAFDKYLTEAYESVRAYLGESTFAECISVIKNANGIPVLAHPITLNRSDTELEKLLAEMISHGLMGIEVYHPKHDQEHVDKYLALAAKHNLLITGGSDYHGPLIKPDVNLGEFTPSKQRIRDLSLITHLKKRQ